MIKVLLIVFTHVLVKQVPFLKSAVGLTIEEVLVQGSFLNWTTENKENTKWDNYR